MQNAVACDRGSEVRQPVVVHRLSGETVGQRQGADRDGEDLVGINLGRAAPAAAS